jgi:hypothetical protein
LKESSSETFWIAAKVMAKVRKQAHQKLEQGSPKVTETGESKIFTLKIFQVFFWLSVKRLK